MNDDEQDDFYAHVNALKMRLQFEIRKGEATGIGEYYYLTEEGRQIIEAVLAPLHSAVAQLKETVSKQAHDLTLHVLRERAQPDFSRVTRLELIGPTGREWSHWNVTLEPSVQDEGRTLKLFYKPGPTVA